jgi:hypothetical protein
MMIAGFSLFGNPLVVTTEVCVRFANSKMLSAIKSPQVSVGQNA